MTAEQAYRAAFERLKANKPERLKKYTKANRNTVALEAGKKKGSLRSERYPELCAEIDAYAENNKETDQEQCERLKVEYRTQMELNEARYTATLARELNLLRYIEIIEQQLQQVRVELSEKYPGVHLKVLNRNEDE